METESVEKKPHEVAADEQHVICAAEVCSPSKPVDANYSTAMASKTVALVSGALIATTSATAQASDGGGDMGDIGDAGDGGGDSCADCDKDCDSVDACEADPPSDSADDPGDTYGYE